MADGASIPDNSIHASSPRGNHSIKDGGYAGMAKAFGIK